MPHAETGWSAAQRQGEPMPLEGIVSEGKAKYVWPH